MKFADGAAAVWEKDATTLARALESGWSLPSATLKGGGRTEDLTLILRVVASGWVEGWRLWLRHRPDFASHPIVVEAIIAHAQDKILEILLEQENNRLTWERDEDDLLPPHLMFQLISSPIADPEDVLRIAKVAALLRRAGYDPQALYPGEYQLNDLSSAGHTLWTWAVFRFRFDLAVALGVGDEAFAMAKHEEAMEHWFTHAWVANWLSSGRTFDGGRARITWLEWMTVDRFAKWTQTSSYLRNVELHAAIRSLPAPYQEIAWSTWIQAREEEGTTLLDLVSSILPKEEIQDILQVIQAHLPAAEWSRAWTQADAYGVSPSVIWESRLTQCQVEES